MNFARDVHLATRAITADGLWSYCQWDHGLPLNEEGDEREEEPRGTSQEDCLLD